MLSKMWGFLKYHHPAVASGKFDWDSVYIENLSQIEKTTSNAEFNKELLSIINNLGPLQKNQPARRPDSVFVRNYDLEWMKKSKFLNAALKNRLKEVYQYRNQGENKYININYIPDFNIEIKYENMGFPNQKLRLLLLSRFWNIINYFAPYKYLIGEDWDQVLRRFIPKFISSADTISYYKTLLELAKSVHDGHAQFEISYQNAEINNFVFGKYTVPFYCQIIDGSVIVRKTGNDTLCNKAGIQQGDIILKVDNETIAKQIFQKKRFISASNKLSEDYYLSWVILNGPADLAQLTIKRGNKVFETSIERISSSQNFQKNWRDIINYTGNDVGYKKISDSILLIYAAGIQERNLDTLKYMINRSKAVIFDVRNYPTNDAFIYIADPFLPKPKIINYSTIALPDFPGLFKWKPSPEIGHINNNAYKGKVIILADERTQSQGEYSCMVLQTIPNSITIGIQTAGADGVKTYIPMGGKLALSYSGYGIYYPDKTETQRRGIRIDIPVKKTIESVINDQDVILDEALKYLKAKGID